MKLPSTFEQEMQYYLKDSWDQFLASYEDPAYYGIRYNPLKIEKEDWIKKSPLSLEEIPWCHSGFYYDGEHHQPAKHPYYHAGLYYLQEPSAMLPAALLPVEPGDKVLDLCAAPGGKSTQLAGKLQKEGLLVSNDISVSRTRALVKNLEMAGVSNMVVTSEKPEKLATALPGFFDKILVDAPCSGEGMFRKNPQMVHDYIERGPEYYADLQKEIMEQAIKMLRPGGYLLYSTCTFSPLEDEGIAEWVLQEYPDMNVCAAGDFEGRDHGHPDWCNSEQEQIRNAYRMWPHKLKGEGHFAVLFQKAEDAEAGTGKLVYNKKNAKLSKEAEAFLKEIHFDDTDGTYQEISGKLYFVPKEMPAVKGIRIVRSGLFLGESKKNRFEPSQALAMTMEPDQYKKTISLSVDDERVIKYLKCETIEIDGPDGMVLICVEGYPLGWGKLNRGRLKNKYAAAWRWM